MKKIFLLIIFLTFCCSVFVTEIFGYYIELAEIKIFRGIYITIREEFENTIGLTHQKLTDYLTLRFRNNFAEIKYEKYDEKRNSYFAQYEREEIGIIECFVATVGDDYPIGFFVECKVGIPECEEQHPVFSTYSTPLHIRKLENIWKYSYLGVGSKKTIKKQIKEGLNESIEQLAIVFFKAKAEEKKRKEANKKFYQKWEKEWQDGTAQNRIEKEVREELAEIEFLYDFRFSPGQCIRVIDGDTIVVKISEFSGWDEEKWEREEKVRLIGVDTPETVHPNKIVEPYGPEAAAFTKKMVESKKVRLEFDKEKRGKYGRLLAYVYLEDGTFLNAELIKQGYSPAYTKYPFSKAEEFMRYEQEAKKNKRGLWKE